jgi:hypothetical protein
MVGKMRNILLTLVAIMQLSILSAQFGLSGGLNTIIAFGAPKPYFGFHIGGEIPRDDAITFYGRLSSYIGNEDATAGLVYAEAIDPLTNPYLQSVYYTSKMNYTILEGGTRYYLGDGYDSGFGLYGGSNFSLMLNSVKRKYGDYDQVKYALPSTEIPKGMIFNIGVGLTGGVKHTFAGIGTVYCDVNFTYLLLSQPSNTTAQSTNLYRPLIFNFGLGFRREFY